MRPAPNGSYYAVPAEDGLFQVSFVASHRDRVKVIFMCVLFLFMVEFSMFVMEPPLQEIMEAFVRHKNYPNENIEALLQGGRYKEVEVQSILASAGSWMTVVSMLICRYTPMYSDI